MQARVDEAARVAASGGKNEDGTKQSQRPDIKARKMLKDEGSCVNTSKIAGHVPGHSPGGRHAICHNYHSSLDLKDQHSLRSTEVNMWISKRCNPMPGHVTVQSDIHKGASGQHD